MWFLYRADQIGNCDVCWQLAILLFRCKSANFDWVFRFGGFFVCIKSYRIQFLGHIENNVNEGHAKIVPLIIK